ncbi:MAG: cytochrome d ubiquinol oxidase subunit II, partial [Acetobacteraceae bacterium]
ARAVASVAGWVAAVLFAVGGVWVSRMQGYAYTAPVNPAMAATPLHGPAVARQAGAWLANFHTYPSAWAVPALGFVGMILGPVALRARRPALGWWLGALAWIGTIFTVGISMFPFLMPSSTVPSQSLTVWNASGSQYNLSWMLAFALIFTPAVIAYTGWAFRVMRGKVRTAAVAHDEHSY